QKLQQYLAANKIFRRDFETGKADFTPLIGGKAEPTENTAGKAAVITRDANGNELVASTVDSPQAVQTEANLQKAQFPNQQTQTSLTTSDAVAAGRMGEPPAPTGVPDTIPRVGKPAKRAYTKRD